MSVVIPTYNHQAFVGQAIQSAFAQTYTDLEVIVVDDGSQDGTREEVARYGERVRYIWQENRGLSSARNTGIRAASGEFIGLLDSDDLYMPGFVATLVGLLDAQPDADAVYCSAQTVDLAGRPLPQRIGKVVPAERLRDALLNGGFFPPSCMFARARCYRDPDGLFDESLRRVEDLDLWLRFTVRYKVIGAERPLLHYRIVPQSLSSNIDAILEARLAVLARHLAGSAPERVEEAIGRAYLAAAVEHLQAHETVRASECFARALLAWPGVSTDFDTFFELGLGDQPRGFRGDFQTLDIANSERLLMALLDTLLARSDVATAAKGRRSALYGRAYLALGVLCYGTGQRRKARALLARAARFDPSLATAPRLASTLLRTLVPASAVATARRWKARTHIRAGARGVH
ncbi:MAG: glycosyltransferase [Vicinamibacterales bacterium]